MIYLIKSASYDNNKVFYKIGFAKNLNNRLNSYITDNPTSIVIEQIVTYSKTKHQLETALHKELKALGYKFTVHYGKTTEWIEVDKDKPISLKDFKACKHHKVIALT